MKLGLIGYGYWGPKCVRVLKDIKGCDLTWIADTDLVKLKPCKEQGYRITQEYRDILQDNNIAGVLVLTPASSHYSIIKDCLIANKHVFVEKPITTSSSEAEELVLLAESKKLKLMVGHIYIFHPAIEFIKQAMDQQEFKPPLHFHFQRRSPGPVREDVSVLWDLGPHEISIMTHLTESEPINISAFGTDILGRDRLDVVSVNLRFKKGISASMIFSWVDPVKIRDLTIISHQKILVFNDLITDKIKMFNTTQDNTVSTQPEITATTVPIPNKEPLREELQHFVDCLETGKEPLVSGRDGLAVVKILEDIEKFIKNNEQTNR